MESGFRRAVAVALAALMNGWTVACLAAQQPIAERSVPTSEPWVISVLGERAAGSGAFQCRERTRDVSWSGTCHTAALAPLLEIERSVEPGPDFGERVCRLMEQAGEEIPPGTMEIVASGDLPEGGSLPDSVEVYRLLYHPYATEATLGVSEVDLEDGTPWLHDAGECTAHVMWSDRRALP